MNNNQVVREPNSFIRCAMAQFGYSRKEAATIYDVFLREKVMKIETCTGAFKLVHGIYWDKQVMDNALKLAT